MKSNKYKFLLQIHDSQFHEFCPHGILILCNQTGLKYSYQSLILHINIFFHHNKVADIEFSLEFMITWIVLVYEAQTLQSECCVCVGHVSYTDTCKTLANTYRTL